MSDAPGGLPCTCLERTSCSTFMQKYVSFIFNSDVPMTPFSKLRAQYNTLCVQECGRREFARHVTSMRASHMEVGEVVYLQLAAHFATILHLCEQEDDIQSAKVLMTLAFTFRWENKFVYQELLRHSIWQSMRFWDAAFLHAVHYERKLRSQISACFRDQTPDQRADAAQLHRNTFFGQMSSFISNMTAFDVPSKNIAEFREKMFAMSDLDPEQKKMLRDISPPIETDQTLTKRLESFKIRSRSFLRTVSETLTLDVGNSNNSATK